MRILLLSTACVCAALSACSADDAKQTNENIGSAAFAATQARNEIKVNPCSLLTDDEIAAQVDLTLEPDQRASLHERSVKHQIAKEENREGMFPVCRITWRSVDPAGEQWTTGNFQVFVGPASLLAIDRGAAIEGVGDEAFFVSGMPGARVGNLSVSIQDFPATDEGNGAVELLRSAAQRLHSRQR
jgi:hypothetical protein